MTPRQLSKMTERNSMLLNRAYFYLAIQFLSIQLTYSAEFDKTALNAFIHRVVPQYAEKIKVSELTSDSSKFELETIGDTLLIRGTSVSEIGYGLNYFLNNYCNCQLSRAGENMNLPEKMPVLKAKVQLSTSFKYRYFYNYCTLNYTMSWWDWNRWEKELDWLTLHGVNLALAVNGNEAVWQNTLRKFNFSENEIFKFIPGPAFTAWWLMGNLEGWGGAVSQQWINNRVLLQQKIVTRMRELNIEPVFQGFYGMVPTELSKKFPNAKIHNVGFWAGDTCGFVRPPMLDPNDSLFAQMAEVYYNETIKLYGNTRFWGGDPFHEFGVSTGIDVTQAAKGIVGAMQKINDNNIWVLQAWAGNPSNDLLAGIEKGKALILDLACEANASYNKRNGFNNHNYIWSTISNYGSKVGLNCMIDTLLSGTHVARNSIYSKNLKGIGMTMEGAETIPVVYELLFNTPWQPSKENSLDWLNNYTKSRYGKLTQNLIYSNELLLKSAYNAGGGDAIESYFCARPAFRLKNVSMWGNALLTYDTNTFNEAVRSFSKSVNELKNVDAYVYDLVDMTRQVLANKGHLVYDSLNITFQNKDIKSFSRLKSRFLQLIVDQNKLVGTRKEFLVGKWLEDAKQCATNSSEAKLFEWNARMLLTLWGNKEGALVLRDYSHREWNGLLTDFYLPRWKMFFKTAEMQLKGKQSKLPDYYKWEQNWCIKTNKFRDQPSGDPVTIALEMLHKYLD